MTPEERERLRKQRQLVLARTGPLSSGILPSDLYSYTQMLPTISDEAWYTLPPGRTPEDRQAYRSMVDKQTAGQDKTVLDYLASKRLPTQAETSAAPVSTLPAQTDTTAAPVDTRVRPAVSDVARPDTVATDSGIPSIPSVTSGLSTAAQGRLQARKDKWGGYMDAHAFATGATSRRKSFESGLGNIFAAPKDPLTKEVKIGNKVWTIQWDRASQKWVPLTSAPRWQDKDPLVKEFKEGDKIVYKSFNRKTGEWERTQKKDAPRWQEKDPVTEKDAQDRLRYVTGPNKGELVFPNVKADPKMKQGPNGRWRYMGGDKHVQLVYPGEAGKGIPKEYEPTSAMKELHEYWRQKEAATGQPVPASEKVQDIERFDLAKKAKDAAVPTYETPKNYLVDGKRVLGYVKKEPGEAPVLVDMDGKKLVGAVVAPTAAEVPAWRQKFNLQREQENKVRAEAGLPPLTTEEEQSMLEQWHLTQRVDEAPTPAVLNEWDSITVSFQTSEGLVERMLTQLMNPEVILGAVGGIVQWWESITDQVHQASNLVLTTSRNNPIGKGAERVRPDGSRYAVEEGDLLDSQIYEFGVAEKSSQYAVNVTQLAYTLARNLDPSGRLSDFDVQQQINRITAGGQSKSRQAANLVEVFNGLYDSFQDRYSAAYRRGTITDNIGVFAKGRLAIEEIQPGLWGVGYLGEDPETGVHGMNAFRTWRAGE